jgi:hypothetical protein
MTTQNDEQSRTVVAWLREDAHENAERVLLAALNDVDHIPQRRAWWPAHTSMPSPRLGRLVTAVAVMGVVLLTFALLPLAAGPGGTPSATQSASATVAPSDAGPLTPVDGPLMARTYRIPTSPSILVTFPVGWDARGEGESWDIKKNRDASDELQLQVWGPEINVYPDACANDVVPPRIGPSAADLIAALDAQLSLTVSGPIDVTVGGLPATRIDISVPDGLDVQQCYEGVARVWVDPAGGGYLAFGPEPSGTVMPVYIVETAAGRVVLAWRNNPAASAADNAELDAIVASMVIED